MGGREIYEPSELIKIGCQPRRPFLDHHKPTLQWFLEGSKVGPQWTKPYGASHHGGHYGLSLHVPGQQVASAGGSVEAECRLSLGPHHTSTFKTLRVRVRMISYVDNYHSAGPKALIRDRRLLAIVTAAIVFLVTM
ncbi:uncharacterized protein [Procambarus clarkii]|uniref:uncharacterized protein n=1 Tax=Procambarus clarkii TaxID=6728 RepID=UPI003743D9F3